MGVPAPKGQQTQKDKEAARKLQRRTTNREAMMSLSLLDAPALASQALERKPRANPLAEAMRAAGARAGAGARVSASSADDSSSTATRTSSCVSTREVEDRDNAMNYANSFIQFVKERQLL